MLNNQLKNKKDEWYTPVYAVEPIIKYLKNRNYRTIWCPFDKEDSNYVKLLIENGFSVIYSHIDNNQDFLEYKPNENYDCIVSNPPFSIKDQIFKRCFNLDKPFALIMDPTKIFDSKKRWDLFSTENFELIYLSPRVNYIDPIEGQTSGVPFQSAYVCKKYSI